MVSRVSCSVESMRQTTYIHVLDRAQANRTMKKYAWKAINTLGVIAGLILVNLTVVIGAGRFKNYEYQQKVYQADCQMINCTRCGASNLDYGTCQTLSVQQCGVTAVDRTVTVQQCEPGWTSSTCDQPFCSAPCPAGQVCLQPNTCGCLSGISSSSCTTAACTSSLDCYPGSCTMNRGCICPLGFTGKDCQTLLVEPVISDCSVKVNIPNGVGYMTAASAQCSSQTTDPDTTWVRYSTWDNLDLKWTSVVSTSWNMPSIIINVVEAGYSIGIGNSDKHSESCQNSGNYRLSCDPVSFDWSKLQWQNQMTHNQTININLTARSGGKNIYNPQVTTQLSGPTVFRRVRFRLDLRNPTHCLLNSINPDACLCFPICLEGDIRNDPVIAPKSCGWSDDGSGIKFIRYEVFSMQPDPNNPTTLVDSSSASYMEDKLDYMQNNFKYTCTTPGVYSIKMTVVDYAGNYVIARKLFIYTGYSKFTKDDQIKPFLVEAANETNKQWINQLPEPRDNANYQLTLSWVGRYQVLDPKWRLPAIRLSNCNTGSGMCIDDVYGTRYGMRSVDAISNLTRLVRYSYSFVVDNLHGGRGITTPPSPVDVNSPDEQLTISVPKNNLTDGATIIVWLTATDINGLTDTSTIRIGVDRTAPILSGNDRFSPATANPFTSSFTVGVRDKESGIKAITYSMYDVYLKTFILTNVTVNAVTMRPASTPPDPLAPLAPPADGNPRLKKRAADPLCPPPGMPGSDTCYCIPTGVCFPVDQTIEIDNCMFDKYKQHNLTIQYTVTSQAGISSTGTIVLSGLASVQCRDPSGLPPGAIAGIVIGIGVPLILVVILAGLLSWRYRNKQDPIPGNVRKFYHNSVKVFKKDRQNVNPIYAETGRAGELGIDVITEPQVKAQPPPPPPPPKPAPVSKHVYSAKDVIVDRLLAEGKFATINRGTLKDRTGVTHVAVKALRCDFLEEDRGTMNKKITFLSALKAHENIVKFIGSYDGMDKGPVVLLELCEIPLTDWLNQISEVNTDVIDDMFTFVLGIARGMEYLHSKSPPIVHRRLRVGNVLLKRKDTGYVAKLVGFGPSRDDFITAFEQRVVPKRWLAPETHRTLLEVHPIYTVKTDVWSFGITVWEIFSRGEKPYNEYREQEVGARIQEGEQMARPELCHEQIYQEVCLKCWNLEAPSRPDFKTVCKSLARFRRGNSLRADYYPVVAVVAGNGSANQEYAVVRPS